jgi:hypothetical protein
VFLMATLFFLMLTFPLVEGFWFAGLVMSALYTMVLVSSAVAVWSKRWLWITFVSVGGPAIGINWLNSVYPEILWIHILELLMLNLFHFLIVAVLVWGIFNAKRVTINTICEAVSGYLLIGLSWASLYALLVLLDPYAIQYNGERILYTGDTQFHHFVYYSFTTLTTLGYGDVVPVTPFARSLSTLEAVMGPLYLTILVAKLVSMYSREAAREDYERKDPVDRDDGDT